MSVGLAARVVRGLEWVAAEEIDELTITSAVVLAPREVTFTVPEADATIATLGTVDDVFVRIGVVAGVGRDRRTPARLAGGTTRLDLRGALAAIEHVRPLPPRPTFDVVASLDGDRRFNRFDVEDELGAALAATVGGPYVSRRHGPPPPSEVSLRIILRAERAELMVRLATRPLHRRGWKQHSDRGTLHPPAAAALLRLVGPVSRVIDPFCGDGTILIEASRAAGGTGAGQAIGSDLDASRLANAGANAELAGVSPGLLRADASRSPWRVAPGAAWVTNPPWNRTVVGAGGVTDALDPAWAEAGRTLGPTGTLAVIADADVDVETSLATKGWRPALSQQVRLVGRVCRLVVAVPTSEPGRDPLPAPLRTWRARAVAAEVITETGF